VPNPAGLEVESEFSHHLQPHTESEIRALRRLRIESREVLNHQIETVENLSVQGIETARLSLLLLGILASATTIAAEYSNMGFFEVLDNLQYPGWIFGFFGLSFLLGLFGYGAFGMTFGIEDKDILEYRGRGYNEKELLQSLLASYEEWIEAGADLNTFNAILLNLSQILLILAVGLLVYDLFM
jgi:hypothetical protein